MEARSCVRHAQEHKVRPGQVAQLPGHRPVHQKLLGLILSQGTHLGCGCVPKWGAYRRQLIAVSLSH